MFSIGFKSPLRFGIAKSFPSTCLTAFCTFAQFKLGKLSWTNNFESFLPLFQNIVVKFLRTKSAKYAPLNLLYFSQKITPFTKDITRIILTTLPPEPT